MRSTETIRLIRDGEKGWDGEGGTELGEGGRRYDSYIKTGSDESHFSVPLIVKDKVSRRCPQTTTFEEKGEPKRGNGPSAFLPPSQLTYSLTGHLILSLTHSFAHSLTLSLTLSHTPSGRP